MENVSSLLSFFALYLFIYSYKGLTLACVAVGFFYRNERASEGAVKPRGIGAAKMSFSFPPHQSPDSLAAHFRV